MAPQNRRSHQTPWSHVYLDVTRAAGGPLPQTVATAETRRRAIAKLDARTRLTTRQVHGFTIWRLPEADPLDTIGHAVQRARAENA